MKLPGTEDITEKIRWLFNAAYDNNWLLYVAAILILLVVFARRMEFIIFFGILVAVAVYYLKNYKFSL